jgi:hypothetical protein
VVIVVQCLNPSIAGFNGEAACEAFCGKKFIPVGFTIRFAFFQKEWIVAEQFATISALEAFRMEFSANGIQAISLNTIGIKYILLFILLYGPYLNFVGALGARWCQELLEAIFAVQVALFFNKSNIH